MSSPPACMRSNGRHPDTYFHPDEYLFRRVPLDLWDEPTDVALLDVDAVQLPDISVGRSKFGHPEWVRFDVVNGRYFEEWGILGVRVEDIPPEMFRDGVNRFTFGPNHMPLEKDYPHSEIRAFLNGNHVENSEDLPEDVHLKWRERLLREMRAIIMPRQKVVIRDTPPHSHRLEPFTTR